MNKSLQNKLSKLESLILIQETCINPNDLNSVDYMQGMLNGLICAHSIFDNSTAKYYTMTRRRKKTKIRHKSLIIKYAGRRK
jgi:hypothetical protein